MAAEERVLCFKRQLFENLGVFQGLCLDVDKYFPVVTASANLTYLNRSEAEQDRGHKQLIPYVLILCRGKILRYQRGKGGGETRLHGLFSVGVGGHISEEDSSLFSTGIGYHEAMWRELMEEVAIDETREATVGLINRRQHGRRLCPSWRRAYRLHRGWTRTSPTGAAAWWGRGLCPSPRP